MSPVFPSFRYFISHTPSAAKENCDDKSRIQSWIDQSERLPTVKILARVHFRGITAACVSITGEIIVAHPRVPS
jgi:hypothetical protein